MRVIKIYKSGSSFLKKHYLVFLELEGLVDDEDVDWAVVDWANSDMSGQNNGYTLRWENVKDESEIKSVLENKIEVCNSRIKMYEDDKQQFLVALKKYL